MTVLYKTAVTTDSVIWNSCNKWQCYIKQL